MEGLLIILNGSEFFVLDHGTNKYMGVKISTAEEIVERSAKLNYKSIKNSYMLFRYDVVDAWKGSKRYRKYPPSFKNTSLLWKNLPKNISDIYEQIYTNYKELIPKFKFVSHFSQEESAINITEAEVENAEIINEDEGFIFQTEEFPNMAFDSVNFATETIENENFGNFPRLDVDYSDLTEINDSLYDLNNYEYNEMEFNIESLLQSLSNDTGIY